MKLIDNAWGEFKRLWSIRVALLWAAFIGFYGVWSAFEGVVPWWLFVSAGIAMPVTIVAARLMKQPGTDIIE